MQPFAAEARSAVPPLPGDPAPWFYQRLTGGKVFALDTAGGRYLVLCFLGVARDPLSRAALAGALANRQHFDDVRASFFSISLDPPEAPDGRVCETMPGMRFFWDRDGSVSRLYGAIPEDADPAQRPLALRRFWVVLDPTLRVLRLFPFAPDGSDRAALFAYLAQLPPPERFAGVEIPAPILYLPNVFEPELCRHLIGLYEAHGGEESGVMRDAGGGKTEAVHDHAFKRRKDYKIEDADLIAQLQGRVARRLLPELLKIYSFKATRMERYIVSCYAAEDQAHFEAHRDNITKATEHRRFGVSINLNAEFEGGEVSFPEYGTRGYKPPPGGAVVFPAALLHAVALVTSGRRYAFLPFLYDEEAAKIRVANARRASHPEPV